MFRVPLQNSATAARNPEPEGVFAWRRVEARIEYCTRDALDALRVAEFHTIDHGPDFAELVCMVEAWCATHDVVIWDVVFRALPNERAVGPLH